ncbi:MAG: response regulator transcription factor [Lachnospiraceae bacterium]|nr:response regulator transcription factor [Lachnospiraceae bacterium]
MKKIQIIEDDAALRRELRILLEGEGYAVVETEDYENLAAEIMKSEADLILLDINLPGINGEELLRRFRKEKQTPVIMLTSRTSETDEVLSMSYGADDYITKPYNPTILLLRIAAVFRRMNLTGNVLSWGGLSVHPAKGIISNGEKEIVLTKNEMIIFEVLYAKAGQIVSRDELMTALWDNEEYVNDNALTVNISRLRNKLAELGCDGAVETRKKQGYILWNSENM